VTGFSLQSLTVDDIPTLNGDGSAEPDELWNFTESATTLRLPSPTLPEPSPLIVAVIVMSFCVVLPWTPWIVRVVLEVMVKVDEGGLLLVKSAEPVPELQSVRLIGALFVLPVTVAVTVPVPPAGMSAGFGEKTTLRTWSPPLPCWSVL